MFVKSINLVYVCLYQQGRDFCNAPESRRDRHKAFLKQLEFRSWNHKLFHYKHLDK